MVTSQDLNAKDVLESGLFQACPQEQALVTLANETTGSDIHASR